MTSNYYLEYRFIPQLLDWFKKGEVPVQALVDTKWWEKLFHDNNMEVELAGFSVGIYDECANIVPLKQGRFIAYVFPLITMPPEAKYGVIDIENKKYYTLESDISGKWAVGSQNLEVHSLMHWAAKELSLEEFIQDIAKPPVANHVEKNGCLSAIILFLVLISFCF